MKTKDIIAVVFICALIAGYAYMLHKDALRANTDHWYREGMKVCGIGADW